MEMEVNKQFQSQLEATGMIPACISFRLCVVHGMNLRGIISHVISQEKG